jgi:hypothetical protein
VLSRHSRRNSSVNQVRPSEQVDETVARGKVKPGLPFLSRYSIKKEGTPASFRLKTARSTISR